MLSQHCTQRIYWTARLSVFSVCLNTSQNLGLVKQWHELPSLLPWLSINTVHTCVYHCYLAQCITVSPIARVNTMSLIHASFNLCPSHYLHLIFLHTSTLGFEIMHISLSHTCFVPLSYSKQNSHCFLPNFTAIYGKN